MAKRRKNVHSFAWAVKNKDLNSVVENWDEEKEGIESENISDINSTARLDNPDAWRRQTHRIWEDENDLSNEKHVTVVTPRLVDLPVSKLTEMFADTDEGINVSGGDIAKMEGQYIQGEGYPSGYSMVNPLAPVDRAHDKRRVPRGGDDLNDPEHNDY